MVKVVHMSEKHNCEHLLGQFLDERHYDHVIEEDYDAYMSSDCDLEEKDNSNNIANEKKIIFKFRKNFFSKHEQEQAYLGLRDAATPSENRGLAAGMEKNKNLGNREWITEYQFDVLDYFLDPKTSFDADPIDALKEKYKNNKHVSIAKNKIWRLNATKRDNFVFDEWVERVRRLPVPEMIKQARKVEKEYVSVTVYANSVNSGIAGWFDRYPRIPYGRATTYTRDNPEKFAMAYPFLQSLAKGFETLLPWRYNNQMQAAKKIDSSFLVPGTPFTTITVNKTFRTAAHRDAGDLNAGLSNLLVLSNGGNFTGGYLIAPEYRVAINVRPGDLLLINNHEVIHGNTPIVLGDGKAERVSLVCYFRENMLLLGSKEYEDCRGEFVNLRKLNKEHSGHFYEDGTVRPLWNGITPGMWDSQEWYDYCETKLGRETLLKYHPEADAPDLGRFFS